MNVEITHIFHSGFILETDDILMVFDYYKGNIDLKDKKTIVFVTHGHGDHYTRDIFRWQEDRDNISYILSFDIDNVPTQDNIYIMNPYENLDIENVNIRSFGSTDQGLSFLVNYEDINIIFAGDLNWWHWENDSKTVQEDETRQFKDEIEKIKNINKKIDIAFFPVDPRLGEGFSFAGEYIIRELDPKYFIPMHFGDKWGTSKKFINKMGDIHTNIVDINKKGQIVEIEV